MKEFYNVILKEFDTNSSELLVENVSLERAKKVAFEAEAYYGTSDNFDIQIVKANIN